ncbi:MAG TPA: hypothetical protein VF092_15990 [Longimicrobium sp.]
MAWAPDYITLQELRDFLEVPDDNTENDPLLATYITAASRAIDMACHPGGLRQFGKTDAPEERTYVAEWRAERGRWVVVTDDFMTAPTAVTAGGVAVTGWRAEPRNAPTRGRPYERLVLEIGSAVVPAYPEYEVAVTAVWGWTAVPVQIKLATRLQASRFDFRQASPSGVAGSPEQGNELRLLARLDPDVAVNIAGYARLGRPQ